MANFHSFLTIKVIQIGSFTYRKAESLGFHVDMQ